MVQKIPKKLSKKCENYFLCFKQISKCDTCFYTFFFQGLRSTCFRSAALVTTKLLDILDFFLFRLLYEPDYTGLNFFMNLTIQV